MCVYIKPRLTEKIMSAILRRLCSRTEVTHARETKQFQFHIFLYFFRFSAVCAWLEVYTLTNDIAVMSSINRKCCFRRYISPRRDLAEVGFLLKSPYIVTNSANIHSITDRAMRKIRASHCAELARQISCLFCFTRFLFHKCRKACMRPPSKPISTGHRYPSNSLSGT